MKLDDFNVSAVLSKLPTYTFGVVKSIVEPHRQEIRTRTTLVFLEFRCCWTWNVSLLTVYGAHVHTFSSALLK